jgi:hypothetical protein
MISHRFKNILYLGNLSFFLNSFSSIVEIINIIATKTPTTVYRIGGKSVKSDTPRRVSSELVAISLKN